MARGEWKRHSGRYGLRCEIRACEALHARQFIHFAAWISTGATGDREVQFLAIPGPASDARPAHSDFVVDRFEPAVPDH